ncbi:hybrid sensor histidine kinase/response regulator [Paenibacillus sp. 481]|uniref:hybrid sensor histidine kinase/response regulator n=1 Tax=Paenibacillus sp. 481 TaxID=2835869 RepID=UPI001E65A500|nr:ATP-binding protein [Paenibacillus sp. 481]UHA74916.1 response regulator [Paenibacillus sp. 481]
MIQQLRRRPIVELCFWAVILFLLLGLPFLEQRSESCAVNQQGSMDLTGCQMDTKHAVALSGQWEYIPNQLISPSSEASGYSYVNVPHQWNTDIWRVFSNDVNYATYRLKVELPSGNREYAIRVTNAKMASRLYVDGKLIGSTGQVGTTPEMSIPYNYPYIGHFSTDKREVELTFHVSNFHFKMNNGVSDSIYIGTQEAIHKLEKRKGFYDVIIISCFFFMFVYFLGENVHRREGTSAFYFPLFCLSGAAYVASHGEKVLIEYIPSIPFEILIKIQFISGIGASYFFLAHAFHQFKPYGSARLIRVAGVHCIIAIIVILLTSMSFNSQLMYYLLVVNVIGLLYIVVMSIQAMRHKLQGSFYIFISVLASMQVIGLMISRVGWVGPITDVPPLGLPIFVLVQGLFFSSRFSNAYNQIKLLSEQLVDKMKEQEKFLVRTSHELKTPLNAIINISQSMMGGAGGQLNAAQESDLRLMHGTARRMSYLVKDILDYEQIKNQRLRLQASSIDVHRVVSVVIEIFRHLNMSGAVAILNEVKPRQHYVVADENRLMQILYNLLDNALKHTDIGVIKVTCVNQGNWEAITVSDTGVGIEHNQLDRIFKEYEQLGNESYTDTSGIGIGLPITKQLVEIQGGHIHVRSTVGEGSSFTFTLPAVEFSQQEAVVGKEASEVSRQEEIRYSRSTAESQERQIAKSAAALPVKERDKLSDSAFVQGAGHILLVDDNYASIKALANLLELEGYTCEFARSGEAALVLLEHGNRFNLCIMDVMMPKMSGFDLCRIIRQMYNQLELPVLMATAGSNTHLNQAGFEAGANDFIHKPYDWTDLRGRVRTLVQLKGTVAQLVQSERDMLRAQIKPHFLFNSINTIVWMSKRDSDKTRELLHALSDFLRGNFDFNNQETEVSFASELRLIEAYLSLERARFGERLNVEFVLEEQEFRLPPLLLQPIVENAVHHGIMEKVEGGTVLITSRRVGAWIELTVSDDGVGADPAVLDCGGEVLASSLAGEKRRGIGLANINRRLRSLYGTSLIMERRDGGGTIVTMRIHAEKE